jgi:hypothetical protein
LATLALAGLPALGAGAALTLPGLATLSALLPALTFTALLALLPALTFTALLALLPALTFTALLALLTLLALLLAGVLAARVVLIAVLVALLIVSHRKLLLCRITASKQTKPGNFCSERPDT